MGQKKTLKLGDKEAKRIVSRGRGRAGHGGAAAPSMSTWNPGNHTGTGAQVLCRAVHLILALGNKLGKYATGYDDWRIMSSLFPCVRIDPQGGGRSLLPETLVRRHKLH